MTRGAIRAWYLVHKWTSIVCTAFLLMLCVTGLPLIFHHEIDELAGGHAELAPAPAGTTGLLSLDTILAEAVATRPGERGLYMSFDEDRPVVNITTGAHPSVSGAEMTIRSYDQRTGTLVGEIDDSGVMHFLLQLHTDMFLGLPGMLFLGFMGLLFVAAIISGAILYAPFMRKLDFGTIRASKATRTKWLDYHNLLGIVALAWMTVVGLTGVINTLADPIIGLWQNDEVADMTAAYRGKSLVPPERQGSIQAAIDTARAAAPGNRVQFVAFPGVAYSSPFHYAVFLQGDTPLTKGLLTPALIDAEDGTLTAMRPMPWYVKTLALSRPLHFGDYGGLPLKILWAILDIFTIIILGSGIYLWLGKRHTSLGARVREVESGGRLVPAE